MSSLTDKISKKIAGDKILWLVTVLLCIISVMAVYGIGGTSNLTGGSANTRETFGIMFSQIGYIVVGLVLMFIFSRINFRFIGKFYKLILIAAVIILLITLYFGVDRHGARRSLMLWGKEVQTLQFVEVAFVLFFARWLAKLKGEVNQLKYNYLWILLYMLLTCLFVLMAKTSGAIILGCTYLSLLFVSQLKIKNFLLAVGLFAALGSGYYFAASTQTGQRALEKIGFGRAGTAPARIEQKDTHAETIQTEAAIATAELLPKQGGSIHKTAVAQSFSDYIFAFTVEEFGLLIGVFIVLLYLTFFYRSVRAARRITSTYGSYLAVGLSSFIILHAFVHIFANLGIIALTGEILPLITRGGISIIVFMTCIGIILNITWEAQKDSKDNMVQI
ncbi:MAG: FtsW/RodA/SpoVE family cell cycle protein [Bacteroidales bacterium]|jgi:cell division protein FtsW|nr:FtsW/RodA/SpoVE family cell cycle protein [Bacteroidales bacterium]